VEADLADHATLGCLWALAREAVGDPLLVAVIDYRDLLGRRWDDEELRWCIRREVAEVWVEVSGRTEGELLEQFLVGLAGVSS
jgi:hypothetical protein